MDTRKLIVIYSKLMDGMKISMVFMQSIIQIMLVSRQERFIKRFVDSLKDPRVTDEVRKVWVYYCAQVKSSKHIARNL